ncbi:HlyD family secretion protein [Agaribacterium haliotis]|uniref:HlyD family secretion protein n=1 Tax=Agaribacterium haliotis TaxID=2013869 RepID=UPI000BB53311|nr:efflux RND transporter periplasmic adaptor subunit [Agaribacterium haliotis]
MDLLLILTYVALCTVVFKVAKIPLNKWTVPSAALGGIFLIGALIVLMNYNHPYSEKSREYFVSTPIIPAVRGRVVEVAVEANQVVEAGSLLFRIDPAPFEDKIESLEARLVAARADQQRAEELMRRKVGIQRDLDQATALVEQLEADLEVAVYDLQQCEVRAPSRGWVTQQFLHEGMMLVPMPLRPAMVFVHDENYVLVAWFRQNSTMRLEPGFEAEVAFDALPGEVFSGKIRSVLPVLAQGELQANGRLLSSENDHYPGRIPVIIDITDAAFLNYKASIPGGAFAQAAVYSDHFEHVAIMRKVLLRMNSWMNYLFPFH